MSTFLGCCSPYVSAPALPAAFFWGKAAALDASLFWAELGKGREGEKLELEESHTAASMFLPLP